MAKFAFKLVPAQPLSSADVTVGAINIREREDLAIVSVATPKGGEKALSKQLKSSWNLAVPSPRISTTSGETRAVWTAPDQLLLMFPHDTPDAERVVRNQLNGAGYTTDQTDNWVALEVSGQGVHAALERLSPVDLSDAAFPVDASARTVMEHLGTLVIRIGPETFLLMSANSSAVSFLHAVTLSAEYTQP